jgi:acyl-CoA reductase-like NAD-dependent aldehyde dehydrogenase
MPELRGAVVSPAWAGVHYHGPVDSTLVVDNPFTLTAACSVPLADEEAIGRTLERAVGAARSASEVPIRERVALCERAVQAMISEKESIARDVTAMMGKPLGQARNEVDGMVSRARYMASIAEEALSDVVPRIEPGFERRIVKSPLGVVLDLPAWNYPLLTAVNVVIPAVLAGNAVIVKHSPRTPLSGEHFARAFREAGASPHLVQALHCDHPSSERLVGDPRIDHVVYTGSVHGGHRIVAAASSRFLHVGLELGGNDPAYVAPDCDFENTVANIVDGAIYNAGQSCCAVERVYVHRSLYARFVEASEALIRTYVLGDPTEDTTTLGPIAQPRHPAELEALVSDASRHGARLVLGGHVTSIDGKGRFFEATLLADAGPDCALMQRESFGPILPVSAVDSDEEALQRMNASALGLTASVWTRDRERADRMARSLAYGTVFMNRCDHVDPSLPWSGWKDSGRGASLSRLGFDQLTRSKALHYRLQM